MGKRKRTKGQTTIYKTTKDRLTRASLETMGELMCSGRVRCPCSTSHVTLGTNPVISHERGKDRELEHIRGHLWHICFVAINQIMVATVKLEKPLYEVCIVQIKEQVGVKKNTVCSHMYAGCLLKNTSTNSKYVVNQKLEHFDDINITIGLEPNIKITLFYFSGRHTSSRYTPILKLK